MTGRTWLRRTYIFKRMLKHPEDTLKKMPIYHVTIQFRKPALLIFVLLAFVIILSFYTRPPDRTNAINPDVFTMFRVPSVNKYRNIFFIESSCVTNASRQQYQPRRGIKLTARQACAIESAARANPHAKVYLLHTCPLDARRLVESNQFVREVFSYPNVFGHLIDVDTFLEDTPLTVWALTEALEESKFPVEHASDVLRLVTLWKWGGVYMDLDFIVLKSLRDLGTNFAGFETGDFVANGILSFDPGHQLAEQYMKSLLFDFEPNHFAANGPELLAKSLLKYCNVETEAHLKPENCDGFTVYRSAYFYPIDYEDYNRLFDPTENVPVEIMKLESYSYAVHTWNYVTNKEIIQKEYIQIYGGLAAKYCPMVYTNAGPFF